jgi:signal transduction histidine kinase/CheY-like chemotaxis protein
MGTSSESSFPLDPGWKSEFQSIQRQLRNDSLLGGMAVLIVLGVVLIISTASISNPFWVSISVMAGYLGSLLAYVLRGRSPSTSAAVITVAFIAVIFILIAKGQIPSALFLSVIPVGFFTLYFGERHGAIFASIVSLALILLPQTVLTVPTVQRNLVILLVWVMVFLIWLLLRSLLGVIGWAWQGYRSSVVSLEQARESQGKLQESLANLREANSQLTRLNQLAQNLRLIAEEERRIKEEFVANVSHELRTPLNMIVGFCSMILQSPKSYGQSLSRKLLVDLEVIYRNSQILSSLIDDVLDLSQIDAGKMALTKEKTAIEEVISEAVTAVQPLFHSKGLYLKVDLPKDLPQIWCDRTRIREVLMNLLSNAGRFTEFGGITLRAESKNANLVVCVADTGPGMTAEEKKRLFRPFEQLDNSIRKRFGGTGLGLSISKSFIEMHDGKIWVESEKNIGTSFYFQLPVEPVVVPVGGPVRWLGIFGRHEERRHYRMEDSQPVKPRILVVEDGSVMQKLLSRYFPAFDTCHAPTLENAFQRIEKENAVALLVNDPFVSQSIDRLRESGKLPLGIPAIVCSIAGEEQASAEFGVANYLVKPIHREVLLDAICKLNRPIRNVLVVDDEPDARQLFKRMLDSADEDYNVIRAEDGELALEELSARKIDLILLDLSMPNLDGFQFLAVKNSNPDWKDIPVILISARDPYGHPITSSALAVTYGNGLSTRQILDCVEALTAILAPSQIAAKSPSPAPTV